MTEQVKDFGQEESINKETKNKKVLLALVAALCVAVLVLVVAMDGLNIKDTNDSLQGSWILAKVVNAGGTIEGEELKEQYGGDVVYNLQAEGNLVIEMIGQEFIGEWTQSGDKVELMYNGSVTELQFDGEVLTMGDDEVVYTLELKN